MQKVIWTCWFQGRQAAPELVRKCLQSWEERNAGWDIRCLDATTISRYIDLDRYIDLTRQSVTAASLSDILRILLLHEYGGVWVDATALCNLPLDQWLFPAANTGFFAFAVRGFDHALGSWFLAAESGNPLLEKWTARVIRYWHGRERADDYFWLHRQFGELCAIDNQAFRAWQAVPRISALEPPHSIQLRMYEDFDAVRSKIDWTVPVFKLTYRLDANRLTPNCLLARVLNLLESDMKVPSPEERTPEAPERPIGLLNVRTEQLGDHIQSIAAESLLRRAGLGPLFFVDRDEKMVQCPPVASEPAPCIVLGARFETVLSEWPSYSACLPLYLGFHMAPSMAPGPISPPALDHYRANGPVGCSDRHTLSLLRSHGVEAFLSHSLSITFAHRLADPDGQQEVFVVSRDRRILDYLPASLHTYIFVSHYSESNEFAEDKRRAAELLKTYRDRAKLIVTTMLQCALPAIAMGIPVVVFYPPNEGAERKADLALFSSVSELVRVFWPSEATLVDWQGYTCDVSALKLKLVDCFFAMAARWGRLSPSPIGPIAPSSALPVPVYGNVHLAKVAADFIRDGSKVLEIGTGLGTLRGLIVDRCNYTGADLEPLDEETLVLDLDNDPMPRGSWDTIVLLEVLEYLNRPAEALGKIASASSQLVISYCCCRNESSESIAERRGRGWINSMTELNLKHEVAVLGFHMSGRRRSNSTPNFEEIIFQFTK